MALPSNFLGQHSLAHFFASQRRNEIVLVRSHERNDAEILSLKKIEDAIFYNKILVNNLSLSKDETPLDKFLYSDGVFIDPLKVRQFFIEGCSVIFRGAHAFFRELNDLVADFSSAWNCEAQGNLYFARAGVNATYPHFDPHELFIIQLAGKKAWRIFEQNYVHPNTYEGFDAAVHGYGALKQTITLHEGDLLFLPRGTIHQPVSVTGSAHLSIGLKPLSFSQVLEGAVRECAARDERFRALAVQGLSQEEIGRALSALIAILGDRVASKPFIEALTQVDLRTKGVGGDADWLERGLKD